MTKNEIQRIRRWLGLTCTQMGERIGAHYSTVSMLESGKRKPTIAQIVKLTALRDRAVAKVLKELEA